MTFIVGLMGICIACYWIKAVVRITNSESRGDALVDEIGRAWTLFSLIVVAMFSLTVIGAWLWGALKVWWDYYVSR